ncbi:MAG TPA: hypothetical protein VIJ12_08315 [Candidatus Baltobacteraceae bacterium]
MWMPPPGKPSFAKALFVVAFFIVPIAWGLHFVFFAPPPVWDIFVPIVTLAAAAIVHSRMANDWRAQYEMNLNTIEQRNAVGRNIRIDRR